MRGVDAAVDHRHHEAGAVEALSPSLVGADDRDTVPENRLVNPVFHDPLDEHARGVQLLQRGRPDLQRNQRRRHVTAKDTVRVFRQPAQHSRGGVGDLLSVGGSRLAREPTFSNAVRGKRKLDEDAHLAFRPGAIVNRGRDHTSGFVARCRDCFSGMNDGQQQQARDEVREPPCRHGPL